MKNSFPIAYAAYCKDISIRLDSTSGGIFTVLATYFIDTFNAKVYGAVFNEKFVVEHVGVESTSDLDRLRGSKYPQSRMNNVYKNIKDDLVNNRYVFFVGTPCQVNGLHAYLGSMYNNLYCMDFEVFLQTKNINKVFYA